MLLFERVKHILLCQGVQADFYDCRRYLFVWTEFFCKSNVFQLKYYSTYSTAIQDKVSGCYCFPLFLQIFMKICQQVVTFGRTYNVGFRYVQSQKGSKECLMESARVRYLRAHWFVSLVRFLIQTNECVNTVQKEHPCGIVFVVYILRFFFPGSLCII